MAAVDLDLLGGDVMTYQGMDSLKPTHILRFQTILLQKIRYPYRITPSLSPPEGPWRVAVDQAGAVQVQQPAGSGRVRDRTQLGSLHEEGGGRGSSVNKSPF